MLICNLVWTSNVKRERTSDSVPNLEISNGNNGSGRGHNIQNCSRWGRQAVRLRAYSLFFFYICGVVHREFVPQGQTVNASSIVMVGWQLKMHNVLATPARLLLPATFSYSSRWSSSWKITILTPYRKSSMNCRWCLTRLQNGTSWMRSKNIDPQLLLLVPAAQAWPCHTQIGCNMNSL